jgi:hypothetical protein
MKRPGPPGDSGDEHAPSRGGYTIVGVIEQSHSGIGRGAMTFGAVPMSPVRFRSSRLLVEIAPTR